MARSVPSAEMERAGTAKGWVTAALIAVAALLGMSSCSEDLTPSSTGVGQPPSAPQPPPAQGLQAGQPPGRGVAPPTICDRVASTSGSDGNAGAVASPYRSAQRLADSLGYGQTGCLRAGTFAGDNVEVTRPGITLTSYPGERATLRGELKIEKGADRVTVSNLNIDARSSYNIGPLVFAANTTFDNVDVSDYHKGICFILGASDPSFGRALNTVIEESRIHDCGRLPSTNGDHGIYVAHSDGAIIRDNWIYGNTDRGIQLYPDSQGTQVYGNVIDGNGEGIIISGDGDTASSNNLVFGNVISNSRIRWNVESLWPNGIVGSGNVVRDNCLWASNPSPGQYNRGGGIIVPSHGPRGFSVSRNVVARPQFAAAAAGDLRLPNGSRCGALLQRK
jgi:hypothetical protein